MEAYHPTTIWKNYRIMLHDLREDQKENILKISNARRFVYNWALNECIKSYDETKKIPGFHTLCSMLTELRHQEGYEWLLEINLACLRYAIKDLLSAYHNYFLGICRRPKFMSRKHDSVRFATRDENVTFRENGTYVFIPGISITKGDLVYCGNHNIPVTKALKYTNVRIKFDGINYWMSMSICFRDPIKFDNRLHSDEVVGIDIGIRTPATLSNGMTYSKPNLYRSAVLDNRRDMMQSSVDRDVHRRIRESRRTKTKYEDIPKSKNQVKRERKLSKARIDIRNFYQSHYHRISRQIANHRYGVVVLEDLHVSGMFEKPGKQLRHQIYESRMATLSEYISYKCRESGTTVIYADRNFKSSQICSSCGKEYKVGKEKTYNCPHCGLTIDRDLNAALNLRNFGISMISGN